MCPAPSGIWAETWGSARLGRHSHLTASVLASPVNITQPTLKLLHSSCNPKAFHSTIQLYCFVDGHAPDDVTITWLKDGQQMPDASPSVIPIKKEGKLASTYSELNITMEQWMSESTFSCKVTSQDEDYEIHTQKCQGRPSPRLMPRPQSSEGRAGSHTALSAPTEYEPRGVNTYLIPPSPLDLYVRKAPKLTCLVVDLESKENVTVTWTQEHRNPAGLAAQSSTRHHNATTSITSILPVDVKDWIEGEGYRCSVNHPQLPRPIVRAITKAQGKYGRWGGSGHRGEGLAN